MDRHPPVAKHQRIWAYTKQARQSRMFRDTRTEAQSKTYRVFDEPTQGVTDSPPHFSDDNGHAGQYNRRWKNGTQRVFQGTHEKKVLSASPSGLVASAAKATSSAACRASLRSCSFTSLPLPLMASHPRHRLPSLLSPAERAPESLSNRVWIEASFSRACHAPSVHLHLYGCSEGARQARFRHHQTQNTQKHRPRKRQHRT